MPPEVERILRDNPVPLVAFDLGTLAIIGANDAAYGFLDKTPRSLEGTPANDVVSPVDRGAAAAAAELLASGAVEGYRGVRHFPMADGTDAATQIWVRLVNADGYRFGLVGIEPEAAPAALSLFDPSYPMAIITTDHDWVVEHVSSDIAEILDCASEVYKGSSLLGMLQPADTQKFMLAIGQMASETSGATLRLHLRAGHDRWQEVYGVLAAMCRHAPPRLGLAFTAAKGLGEEVPMRCHREITVRGGDMIDGMVPLEGSSPSESLSTRQWEILMRLVRGERVRHIAAGMYLSPSTVRNHLTAIYRKFGVHSQAELLAKLLEARR